MSSYFSPARSRSVSRTSRTRSKAVPSSPRRAGCSRPGGALRSEGFLVRAAASHTRESTHHAPTAWPARTRQGIC
jgi:hypothetical protein